MAEAPTLEIALLATQDEFIFSARKYTAFIGGIRSGKTYAGCLKALNHVNEAPGSVGMIIAPTYQMLRDSTLTTLFGILDDLNWPYTYESSKGVITFWNGSIIYTRSADKPSRIRGVELDWAMLDEAALMKEMIWRIVKGRLSRKGACAWLTTTPAGFNWIWHDFTVAPTEKHLMVRARTKDNVNLPSEYVDDIIAAYSGEFSAQELDGEFVAFEGLVYSEFRTSDHTYAARQLPESWDRYVVIDYGFVNPFAALWIAVDGDGRMWVYRELYRSGVIITENASAVKQMSVGERIVAAYDDHDADDHAVMLSVNTPFPVRKAEKGDVRAGIARLKNRLKKRKDGTVGIRVSEDCPYTIKEFGMYRWREKKEERDAEEEPLSYANHALDGIRYLCNALDVVPKIVRGVKEYLEMTDRLPKGSRGAPPDERFHLKFTRKV
jgi:PBSX family phage terminase large subunit